MPLNDQVFAAFIFSFVGFGLFLLACDHDTESCLDMESPQDDFLAECRAVMNPVACCTAPDGSSHTFRNDFYQLDGPPQDATDLVCLLLAGIGATTCDIERCAAERADRADECALSDDPVCVAVDYIRGGWMEPQVCPKL